MSEWQAKHGIGIILWLCLFASTAPASLSAGKPGHTTERLLVLSYETIFTSNIRAVKPTSAVGSYRLAQASCRACGTRSRACHAPCKRMSRGPGKGACHARCKSASAACQRRCKKGSAGNRKQLKGKILALKKRANHARWRGQYDRSLKLYQQVLNLQKGPAAKFKGGTISSIARVYLAKGEYKKALSTAEKGLKTTERYLGKSHEMTGHSLLALSTAQFYAGKFVPAKHNADRAIGIFEKRFGTSHQHSATAYYNQGTSLRIAGQFQEAEKLFKKAADIREKKLGADHHFTALTLHWLAWTLNEQGRYVEAAKILERTYATRKKAYGEKNQQTAQEMFALAWSYHHLGRQDEARELLEKALQIQKKALGTSHYWTLENMGVLGEVYGALGRFDEAIALLQQSLDQARQAHGRKNPITNRNLYRLAKVNLARAHLDKAETFGLRAIALRDRVFGENHPSVARAAAVLGDIYMAQNKPKQAHQQYRRAAGIASKRAMSSAGLRTSTSLELQEAARYFDGVIKAAWAIAVDGNKSDPQLAEASFGAAQWADRTSAGAALAQTTTRIAAGDGKLGDAIRRGQDLDFQRRAINGLLLEAIGSRKASDRKEAAALQARLRSIEQDIAKLNLRLQKEFPAYGSLANPDAASPSAIQAQLGPDEALVTTRVTKDATYVWGISKNTVRWARVGMGDEALRKEVASLRKSLDPISLLATTGRGFSREEVCRGFSRETAKTCEGYDFNLDAAHRLYAELLGPIQDVLTDKRHLIVIASGALTGMPFHLLLTAPPARAGELDQQFRSAPWLLRSHATTVLPSVSSLGALRGVAKSKPAPRPFIGFGNPRFVKPGGKAREPETIRLANATRGFAAYFRGGQANLDALSGAVVPLPDTADEILAVGKVFKAQKDEIILGRKASETTIKRLSKSGRLGSYRVVHFATHGLVAGEVKGLAEPALLFSLPAKATSNDDGLLTASEVAQLKLNADWVVLSACNTAAGDKPGAEALSGLARAFFYSGSRALLVSHWPVVSAAAVKLTTRLFGELEAEPAIGRAEALRRAMLELIDNGAPHEAHPAYWAPFVVVGDGGPIRRVQR